MKNNRVVWILIGFWTIKRHLIPAIISLLLMVLFTYFAYGITLPFFVGYMVLTAFYSLLVFFPKLPFMERYENYEFIWTRGIRRSEYYRAMAIRYYAMLLLITVFNYIVIGEHFLELTALLIGGGICCHGTALLDPIRKAFRKEGFRLFSSDSKLKDTSRET